MADVINIGQNVNDGTGDDLRTAFTKVNQKFAELEALGGETNSGVNVGSTAPDAIGVFAGKTGTDLEFRKIKSANPAYLTVEVGPSGDIVLNNLNVQTPAFRNVQAQSGPTINATAPSYTLSFLGGNNITTESSGGNILINGQFELSQDPSPSLGGNLDMTNADIIGPGNITNITKLTVIGTDIVNPSTISNLDITNQLRVSAATTFSNNVTVSGSSNITLGTGSLIGNVTGDLTGNIIGGLGNDLNLNQYTITGQGSINVRTPNSGNPVETEGGFYMQTDDSNPSVAFRLITANNSESDAFVGIESHSLSTIDPGFGTGIEFSVGSGSLNSLKQLGSITGVYDDASNYSIEIKAYGPGLFYDAPAIAKFKGNNEIILGRGDPAIKIKDNRIESYGVSNSNLIFDADGAGYIDFYGIYQFPRSIGQAGQVLKVPTSGTVLEWGTGGGGATTTAITAITLSNPLRITTGTAHGLTDNQNVTTTDIVGTTELNGNSYYVDVINSTTVDLYTDEALSTAVDGTTGFTAYTSGGYITGAAGAGGGSFVALSDTPNSYLAAAGDADKLVQVNGTGNGLIFTDPNALISATYIENKGFLPKAGGTMSGNLNVGGNITLNPSNGRIDATTVYGTFYGFLNGNANGNHTGTYNGPVGGVTPNTIVGTTITANTGFVGNLTGDTTGTHSGNVNGNVTGNLQGNVTGNVVGILNGNVTATSGSSSFNIINSGSINATGQITANSFSGNLTSTGTSNFNIVDVSGNIYNSVGNVLVNDNLDVTGNVAVTGNVSATGTLDVTGRGQIADLRIEGSSIENDNSNGGVRIAANGTGFIELQGNVRLNGPIAYSNNSDQIIGTTQTPATISANTTVSFITTQNWTSASAGLAYANLADGTYEGHIKILKMVSRGTYSIDGGVQNFDRYLQVNLKINGASSTVNLSENSEFGALTLIWHGGSWWILSQFDS